MQSFPVPLHTHEHTPYPHSVTVTLMELICKTSAALPGRGIYWQGESQTQSITLPVCPIISHQERWLAKINWLFDKKQSIWKDDVLSAVRSRLPALWNGMMAGKQSGSLGCRCVKGYTVCVMVTAVPFFPPTSSAFVQQLLSYVAYHVPFQRHSPLALLLSMSQLSALIDQLIFLICPHMCKVISSQVVHGVIFISYIKRDKRRSQENFYNCRY